MKTHILPVAGLLVLIISSGCVVSIGGKETSSAPPPVLLTPSTSESALMAEIDAARKLAFEEARFETLNNIAGRIPLPEVAQAHLVDTTLRTLSVDEKRVQVMLTLIQNPQFSPTAKEYLLRKLNQFAFEESKTRILGVIQAREQGT